MKTKNNQDKADKVVESALTFALEMAGHVIQRDSITDKAEIRKVYKLVGKTTRAVIKERLGKNPEEIIESQIKPREL